MNNQLKRLMLTEVRGSTIKKPGYTSIQSDRVNTDLLFACQTDWEALSNYRGRRRRARLFVRGDHYLQRVPDPQDPTKTVTEEELYNRRGVPALKQNVIRVIVRNILGMYRDNPSKVQVTARSRENAGLSEMLTNALQSALDSIDAKELDARALEELIISGMVLKRNGYEYDHEVGASMVTDHNINPNRVAFNSDMSDTMGKTLRRICVMYDDTIEELISKFAHSKEDEDAIREMYRTSTSSEHYADRGGDSMTAQNNDNIDFTTPSNPSLCRWYDIWVKKYRFVLFTHDPATGHYGPSKYTVEQITAENNRRVQFAVANNINPDNVALISYHMKKEVYWEEICLSNLGHTLMRRESPFMAKWHPFTLLAWPMVDGEAWGLVEDIIDQQRYINRLVMLQDIIMGTSAKNTLVVEEDSVLNYSDDELRDEISKIAGVLRIKKNPNAMEPKYLTNNTHLVGVQESLALQLQFVMQISGINPAQLGHEAKSGTPASMYITQAQQSTVNTKDMLESFVNFTNRRNRKVLNIIQKFYTTGQYIGTSGRTYSDEAVYWNAEKMEGVKFDLAISQGLDTPAYRQIIEQPLMEMLNNKHIDLKMFLRNTSMPYADKLLQMLQQQEEAIKRGELGAMPQQLLSPEEQQDLAGRAQQAQQQANPQAMELLQRGMQAL